MIKTFLSRATVGIVACFSLFMTSCIQEEYKISEETLDLEVTVFQEGVALPIGSTDKITIGKVLELYGTDEIKDMLTPQADSKKQKFSIIGKGHFPQYLLYFLQFYLIEFVYLMPL